MDRVTRILNRISSGHLESLRGFYRDAFQSDDECLQFLYDTFRLEPETSTSIYREKKDEPGCFVDDNGNLFYDTDFIPRRMLNAVERLVSAARDMEITRRGKDAFKVVLLVACAETLQKLAGRDKDGKGKDRSKKDILFEFFEQFTREEDKKYIAERFEHSDEDAASGEDSFKQFVGAINEYRNCAAHEGEYWTYCFKNNLDDYPVPLVLRIDLERFSQKNKKEHVFNTSIHYSEFEKIFIRTCIAFIRNYVGQRTSTESL